VINTIDFVFASWGMIEVNPFSTLGSSRETCITFDRIPNLMNGW
jgi:hypothetical protein